VCQYYNISYNSKSRRVPLEKNLSCNWLKIENMSGHLTFRRKVSVSIEKNKLQDKNTPIVSKCDVFAVKETKLFLFNLIQTHKYKKLWFSETRNVSVVVIMVVVVVVVVVMLSMCVCMCVCVCVCVCARACVLQIGINFSLETQILQSHFPLFVENRTIATTVYV